MNTQPTAIVRTASLIARQIATFGYVGYAPKAPGTMGSIAAALIATAIYYITSTEQLIACAPLIIISSQLTYWIGTAATARYMHDTNRHDPKEVVIDEVSGLWHSYGLILLASYFKWITLTADHMPLILVLGFITFRFFDIVKLGPIKWADESLTSAHGVMLDDLLAGCASAVVTIILILLFN